MPGPPPPPPMAPSAPPPPSFSLPKSSDNRGALLNSIRQGTKLKKTVTVDKSAPVIPGKITNVSNSNSNTSGNSNISNNSTQSTPNGLPLGGLFAGGMPKLKRTGRLGSLNSSNANNNNSPSEAPTPKIQPSKNFSSVQEQLKRQINNFSDTRTRGPPPPAPTRNISVDETRTMKPLTPTENSANGLHLSQMSLPAISKLHMQNSRKSKSNVNLVSLDSTDSINNSGLQSNKPVINHGKPNLAPKPPSTNGKPTTQLKLSLKPNKPISRAQSMRSPRSPSPESAPVVDSSIKFGTVRNMSSLLGPVLTQGSQPTTRQRPALPNRPTVPPPSAPPPATPLKLSIVKPPNHAPPPPPGIPQPPLAPPPPPPHKTQSVTQPVRPPPAIPNSINNINPPPPPPRNSSMRDTNQSRLRVDLDKKFEQHFATIEKFPRPPAFRNVMKFYSNSQVTNKQQAPLPPQLPTNRWKPTSSFIA